MQTLALAHKGPTERDALLSIDRNSKPKQNLAKTRIHLLITDDNTMGCELLRQTFERSRLPIEVIGCMTTEVGIRSTLALHKCDVALINESLNEGPLTGFQAMQEVRQLFPNTRLIMLLQS